MHFWFWFFLCADVTVAASQHSQFWFIDTPEYYYPHCKYSQLMWRQHIDGVLALNVTHPSGPPLDQYSLGCRREVVIRNVLKRIVIKWFGHRNEQEKRDTQI